MIRHSLLHKFEFLLILSAITVSLVLTLPGNVQALVARGDDAISFSGVDLQGNPVDISDLIGKQVIVLKFGSIYCSSCVQSIAAFSQLQQRHSQNELKIIGINLDIYGTVRVKRFYKGYKDLVKFPVMIDKDLKVSQQYGVTTLPSLVVIGKNGKVARVMMGYQKSELKQAVQFTESLVKPSVTVQLAGIETGASDSLRILFPINFTKTLQDTINIIGLVENPGVEVSMALNGGSRQNMLAERNIFYFRTPVSLGSNFIEVSTVGDGGERIVKAIVLFREPKLGRGFQNQFPAYKFHLAENEAQCQECHDMVPPETTVQNFMMITQMCLECHTELGMKSFVHGPITVGGCAPCHDFGSLPVRYELFSPGADLCYGCHAEKEKEFAKSYIHGPLAAGVCSVCHSPHGSNEKYNLRLPQGQMCTGCHEQVKQQQYRFVQHKPFEDGKCTDCHNPHSSDNADYFLNYPGNNLCYSCHDKESMATHRHPVGVVPTFTFAEIKLNELGELECMSCHNPHSAEGEHLLPGNGCAACHTY